MSKKHRLGSGSTMDFGMAGIVCQLPDYRLVHFLNKELEMNLVRMEVFAVPPLPGTDEAGQYSLFAFTDKEYGITFCLLANRGKPQPLVPSLRNVDFLLIMLDLNERYDLDLLLRKLRSINGVTLVQPVDPSKIPGIEEIVGLLQFQIDHTRKNHAQP